MPESIVVPDQRASWFQPRLKLRQWWCSRRHNAGWRLHSWEMIDEHGSIRCRRCEVVRGGHSWWTFAFDPADRKLVLGGTHMAGLLEEYRAEGLIR